MFDQGKQAILRGVARISKKYTSMRPLSHVPTVAEKCNILIFYFNVLISYFKLI